MKTTCTVEGCLRPAQARSYCAPHYSTWHRQQRKYTITCAACNREVQVDRPHRVHCSRICRNKASLVIATRVAAERNHAKDAPHPRSPTLDHLIPLAAGGTHEPLNCRTACFLCNATKGDRGGGEQLLLIA